MLTQRAVVDASPYRCCSQPLCCGKQRDTSVTHVPSVWHSFVWYCHSERVQPVKNLLDCFNQCLLPMAPLSKGPPVRGMSPKVTRGVPSPARKVAQRKMWRRGLPCLHQPKREGMEPLPYKVFWYPLYCGKQRDPTGRRGRRPLHTQGDIYPHIRCIFTLHPTFFKNLFIYLTKCSILKYNNSIDTS